MKKDILIYDTTLRDGAQAEGISFSLEDKLHISKKLDELEVDYIEGGFSGSNPKDTAFFQQVQKLNLKHSKIATFGMTRKPEISCDKDLSIQALLAAKTKVITLVGKSWDFHVIYALKTSLDENLKMIADSISYLKKKNYEVIFDAEHFFDGFKANKNYALKVLKTAESAGADFIVLCETNGGCLPFEIDEITKVVSQKIKTKLGIHCHNDSGCAVANSLMAIKNGIVQVQGTVNGIGERCGNANLITLIPNIKLKLKLNCISESALTKLSETARYISEMANVNFREDFPYVGASAFAHKGGMHVSGIMAASETYEHIHPEVVGNIRRVLVSELSGKSNILNKAQDYGIDLTSQNEETKKILNQLKEKESKGYQYEGADASFELLIKKLMGNYKKLFELEGFRLIVEKRGEEKSVAEAIIKIKVKDKWEHTAAEGEGPVNALDNALRKALEPFYAEIKKIKLSDFKVRVLDGTTGTAAQVRVLIESTDYKDSWGTVGVSENVIEASWQALVDSIEYGINKLKEERKKKLK